MITGWVFVLYKKNDIEKQEQCDLIRLARERKEEKKEQLRNEADAAIAVIELDVKAAQEAIENTRLNSAIQFYGTWNKPKSYPLYTEGPTGDCEICYPNGDCFKGVFQTEPFNKPTYTAVGRYSFADGSYIEQAWIRASEDQRAFDLLGVYLVHHQDDNTSIAMFNRGKRYCFELFLDPRKPYIKEWWADELQTSLNCDGAAQAYEVVDYQLNKTYQNANNTLILMFKSDAGLCVVEQMGGTAYKLQTLVKATMPNGDYVKGVVLKNLLPWHGRYSRYCEATSLSRDEEWHHGVMAKVSEWKRENHNAKFVRLPDPFNECVQEAYVWNDGHIEYRNGSFKWTYDGQIANARPEGTGRLTGTNFSNEKRTYTGEFCNGRCHGQGVLHIQPYDVRMDGTWVNGCFQDLNAPGKPIMLKVGHSHSRSHTYGGSIGSEERWEKTVEAKLGTVPGNTCFKILRIRKDCITLLYGNELCQLKPGKSLSFSSEHHSSPYEMYHEYNTLTWI